jgi:hypothetical protein
LLEVKLARILPHAAALAAAKPMEESMAKNEKSSAKTASLAGKVLQQKSSTATAKTLAGAVLTQAADKKSSPPKKK